MSLYDRVIGEAKEKAPIGRMIDQAEMQKIRAANRGPQIVKLGVKTPAPGGKAWKDVTKQMPLRR